MKKYTIGKYDPNEDQEYLDYLERERREAHLTIYDDAYDNNYNEEEGE